MSESGLEKEIIVDINPYQTRVVLLEQGTPSEIYIERRGRERLVGNIYKGRVQNVLPGMQAAFVDIGLEKNAYLLRAIYSTISRTLYSTARKRKP